MNMAAMALACFSRGTRLAATTAPMPKKAPWLRLVIRRDSNRVSSSARTPSRLPTVKISISDIRAARLPKRANSRVMTGAPSITPTA